MAQLRHLCVKWVVPLLSPSLHKPSHHFRGTLLYCCALQFGGKTLVGRLLTVSTFASSLRGCLSSSACDSLDRRSRRIQMYSSGTRTTWSGRYFYLGITRTWLTESVWNHLLDREDHQIGYQEFIAFAVAYHSFGLSEVLLVEFIDNDGVLLSLLRGSSRLPEINFGVGMTWQDMAARDISLLLGRVESYPLP